MPTIYEEIIAAAEAYPDRPAIIYTDGNVVRYADLTKDILPVDDEGTFTVTTGGSTGKPKVLVITDEQKRARVAGLEVVRGKDFVNVESLFTNIRPTIALGALLRASMLLRGKTLCLPAASGSTVKDWADTCEKNLIQAVALVPKFTPILQSGLWGTGSKYRFPYVYLSGGPASADLMRAIASNYGENVWFSYAASEAGQIAGAAMADVLAIPGCVGRVSPLLTVTIEDGEICVEGDSVASGYEDTTLDAGKFFDRKVRTGDAGHFVGDLLVVDGRI